MKKYLILIILFFIDRISKNYLINLQLTGTDVDFYIYPFLNIYLVWNTGIGFGLFPSESNFYYNLITILIVIINIIIFYCEILINTPDSYSSAFCICNII